MLDRYGDPLDPHAPMTEPEFDNRAATLALKAAAIDNCDLCDGDGYRGSLVCDHVDYRPIAERGIAAVRAAMGWSGAPAHRHPNTEAP